MLDIFSKFQKKKFKHRILSIDGGGLKGYFAAYIAWRMQEDYDINIKDEFDTFAGTSTGALLAAAIVSGVDYKVMVDTYEKGEKSIFLKNGILKRMNSSFFPKYSNDLLKLFFPPWVLNP